MLVIGVVKTNLHSRVYGIMRSCFLEKAKLVASKFSVTLELGGVPHVYHGPH